MCILRQNNGTDILRYFSPSFFQLKKAQTCILVWVLSLVCEIGQGLSKCLSLKAHFTKKKKKTVVMSSEQFSYSIEI